VPGTTKVEATAPAACILSTALSYNVESSVSTDDHHCESRHSTDEAVCVLVTCGVRKVVAAWYMESHMELIRLPSGARDPTSMVSTAIPGISGSFGEL
jgi:hypothetical protein